MEEEVSGPDPLLQAGFDPKESVRVKRKTLQAVLEQCQRALESLGNNRDLDDEDDDEEEENEARSGANLSRQSSVAQCDDREADEVRLLRPSIGF